VALGWWRENRPLAPDLLDEELRGVLAIVATTPTIGALARDARLQGVRRILLRRTRYHLYYRVNAPAGRLEVLALWHARRKPLTL
jgi:plasmid stabilization system protein ParE